MLMQNRVGGGGGGAVQIRCIMGNVEVAFCSLLLVVYKEKIHVYTMLYTKKKTALCARADLTPLTSSSGSPGFM